MKKEQDNGMSIIEQGTRALVGIGIGYTGIMTWRSLNRAMEKNFGNLPISPEIQRAFTRIWQFSGKFFRDIEFEKKLDIRQSTVPINNNLVQMEIDKIVDKRRHIVVQMRRAREILRNVRNTIEKEFSLGQQYKEMLNINESWKSIRNILTLRAGKNDRIMSAVRDLIASIENSELPQFFTGKAMEESLMQLGYPDLEHVRNGLREMNDRVGKMVHAFERMETRIVRSSKGRVERVITGKGGKISPARLQATQAEQEAYLKRVIERTYNEVKETFNPLPIPVVTETVFQGKTPPMDPKVDLILGQKTKETIYRNMREALRDNIKDSVFDTSEMGKLIHSERVRENMEIKRYVVEMVKQISSHKDEVGDAIFDVSIGVHRGKGGQNDSIVVRGIAKKQGKWRDIVLPPLEIPKARFGASFIMKDGKEYVNRYQVSDNFLVSYLKRLCGTNLGRYAVEEGNISLNASQIYNDVWTETMELANPASIRSAWTFNQGIDGNRLKWMQNAYDVINRMRKEHKTTSYIVIDTEFDPRSPNPLPHQMSWTLWEEGTAKDAYQFDIEGIQRHDGKPIIHGAFPEHLKNQRIARHGIHHTVKASDMKPLLDALQETMSRIAPGKSPVIVAKAANIAESRILQNLIQRAQELKLGNHPAIEALRAGINKNAIIDVNNIAAAWGAFHQRSGENYMFLFKNLLRTFDKKGKMRAWLEKRLLDIGISNLNEEGFEQFRRGIHGASVQDSYLTQLFSEFTIQLQDEIIGESSADQFFNNIDTALYPSRNRTSNQGYIPSFLVEHHYKNFGTETDIGKAEMNPLHALHLGAEPYRKGKRFLLHNLIHWHPFSHLVRGQEYQVWLLHRAMNLKGKRLQVALSEVASGKDIGGVLLRHTMIEANGLLGFYGGKEDPKEITYLDKKFWGMNKPEMSETVINIDQRAKSISGDVAIEENKIINDGDLIGWRGSSEKRFKGYRGARGRIKSIKPHPKTPGVEMVTIAWDTPYGTNTPTRDLMNTAGLASAMDIREEMPGLSNKYGIVSSFHQASTIGKANPGEVYDGLLRLAFSHAGTDPFKQKILVDLIKKNKNFENVEISEGPKSTGKILRIADTKPLTKVSYSDIRDVLDEYKKQVDIGISSGQISTRVTGSFTALEMNYIEANSAGGRLRPEIIKSMASPIARTMKLFLSVDGGIEKEIEIGHKGKLSMGTKFEILEKVKARLDIASNTPDNAVANQNLIEAIQLMHPDIEGSTVYSLLGKLPALMGFTKRVGGWQTVLPSVGTMFYNQDVTAGWGKFGTTKVGPYLMSLLKEVPGSEDLLSHMANRITSDNSIALARMQIVELATGVKKLQDMRSLNPEEGKLWLNEHMGAFLNRKPSRLFKNIVPLEDVYMVNGEVMTRDAATKIFHITPEKFDDMLEKSEISKIEVGELAKYSPRFIEKGQENQLTRMWNNQKSVFLKKQMTIATGASPSDRLTIKGIPVMPVAKQDFWELACRDPDNPLVSKKIIIMSQALSATRDVLADLYSPNAPRGFASNVAKLLRIMSSAALKQIHSQVDSVTVPIVRKPDLGLWLTPGDIPLSTKQGASEALKKLFGTKSFSSDMFLNARGVTFGEHLIIGTSSEIVDEHMLKIFQGLSDDEKKFMAKVALGAEDMVGGSTQYKWRSKIIRGAAGGEFGSHAQTWAKDTLSVLQSISSKGASDAQMNAKLIELMKLGVVGLPGAAVKYPGGDASKFIAGMWYKANTDANMAAALKQRLRQAGAGTGGIGTVVAGSLIESRIDADKDAVQFLLGLMGKHLNVVRKHSGFQTLGDNTIIMAGTENGMVRILDSQKNAWMTVNAAIPSLAEFTSVKSTSILDQIVGKELAGSMTTYALNLREHAYDVINGKVESLLVKDLGMDTNKRIIKELGEGIGQVLESVLKMKAGTVKLGEIQSSLDGMYTPKGILEFLDRIQADDSIKENMGLKKLFTPIKGTEGRLGKHALTVADIMKSWATLANKSGMGGIQMHPRVQALYTNTPFSDVYDIADKLGYDPLLKAIGNLYHVSYRPEPMWASAKKFIAEDLSRTLGPAIAKMKQFRSPLTTAGALFAASFMFRPDDNTFLGDRPGLGGEYYDHIRTQPEYAMEGLLNTPINNPWDRKRAYIMMENPRMSEKLGKLSSRERRDMMVFHKAMRVERNSVEDMNINRKQYSDYKSLLSKYGHV